MPIFIDEANKAYKDVLMDRNKAMLWKMKALDFSEYISIDDAIIEAIQGKIKNLNTQIEHLHIPKLRELLDQVDSNVRYELERTIKEEIKNTVVKTLLDTMYG